MTSTWPTWLASLALALALVLGALGCRQYAHRSMHNAPGLAALDTPPFREVGDPEAFEPATEPGSQTITTFVMPNVSIGTGRLDTGRAVTELGLEIRVERATDDGIGLMNARAWGLTFGAGLAQFYPTRPTQLGPVYAELNYRFPTLGHAMPTDIGLGPAIYPGASIAMTGEELDPDVGAQLSLRIPMMVVHARYLAHSGAEITVGFEIPFLFFFSRSR